MKAVIFDLAGVLADSEPLICAADMAMFKEKGVLVRPEDFHPFVGTGEIRYIGGVAEKYGLTLDIQETKRRTKAAAKAAGMRCVAVAQIFPADRLGQADLVRPDMVALTLADCIDP
ncbi:MAG: hypothetical protein R6X19_07845 [Kiritimatiellia bacterium]